jgi:predicted nucleotidyltransferase
MAVRIPVNRERLGEFCRRHRIRRLSVFGSVVRDDFRADSDVDVLVEFEPGQVPGLAFFAIQDELAAELGRPVDLNTLGFLGRHLRDRVRREAEVLVDRT